MKKKIENTAEQTVLSEKTTPKRGRKSKNTKDSSESQVSANAVSDITEKKIDLRTKEGRLNYINKEIEELTQKHDKLLEECNSANLMLNRTLERIKYLYVLLSAFNARFDKGEVRLTKPDKGVTYWYLRTLFTKSGFEVVQCQWNDWLSDHYRYCKGNVFLDETTCNQACLALNEMLFEL